MVIKSDILPALLHLAYVYPIPFPFRKALTKTIFQFFWGGYEYIKRERIYQSLEDGGRDLPNIPLKLDVLFFCNICNLLIADYTHRCQIFLKFWLTIPFRFITQWENSTPKAEAMPNYFCYIVKWFKKNKELISKDNVRKQRILYQKMIEKLCHNDIHIAQIDWMKAQVKGLENVKRFQLVSIA